MKVIFILSLCIVLSTLAIINANVIGLDFGSDSMKVALVQPGKPLEIVTNFQSKRKTPTMITFYKGERLFGSDSNAIMARKPELSFAKINRMLGRNADHPEITELVKDQYFPYDIYKNDTSGATCMKVEDTYYSPEELIAMLMQHAKEMTSSFGGHVIKDCVITVPSSYTHHERMALYTAADIADLKVLSLIEENTAAALHYGVDRVFDEPTTVVFYNMGANSVQVSVVTYSSYTIKEAGKNKTIGQLEVVGKAWDTSLGGFFFDVKLADMLADRFNEVWNKKTKSTDKDLKGFVRPMTRLRLEANKVKEVLSANNEYPIKAEQLHADVDLITKVTRAEFEELCSDLFSRLTKPIDAALAMANLTISNVKSVELLGGGLRIPKVKKVLDEYFHESKIEVGQHLNGDEAMALGAAFRAANLSTAFRVRKVGLSDISTFGVSVSLESLAVSESSGGFFSMLNRKKDKSDDSWHKETALYPAYSAVPSKVKTVAFQHDSDILCKLEYDDSIALPAGTDKLLAVYNITGVAAFAKETESKGLGQPKVHLSFLLDGNGLVSLAKAEATVDLPVEEDEKEADVAATAGGIDEATPASGSDSTNEEAPASSTEGTIETEATDDKKKSAKDSKKANKEAKKASKEAKKLKKDNVLRRVLTVIENERLLIPFKWTSSQVAESKTRLKLLTDIDDSRKAKEAALNDLEAYIYKVKNRIMDDEDKLKEVSTEEQRQEVLDLGSATEEWLYDDGRDANIAAYKDKHEELKHKAESIFKRYSEMNDRPAAVASALAQLQNVTNRANIWSEKSTHITAEEIESLLATVETAREWITSKVEEQSLVSNFEQPVFDSKEVPFKMRPVQVAFEKLVRKPKPPQEKIVLNTNSTTANSTTTGNETVADSTTGAEDSVKIDVEGDDSTQEAEETVDKEEEVVGEKGKDDEL